MIEDEAGYFELLGDMINPTEPSGDMNPLHRSGNKILSMLDDLIVQSDIGEVHHECSSLEIGSRDPLEDMLNDLADEDSFGIEEDTGDSAADTLDMLLREEAATAPPPVPATGNDDDALMIFYLR